MSEAKVGFGVIALTLVLGIVYAVNGFSAKNEYTTKIENHWTLADRASTIEAKRGHIKAFVDAIENSNIQDEHDAIFFKNQENSAFYNLEAVKSLAQRLDQIKDMNPNSFEYQAAIQQITAQEQGEASKMLAVLENCWFKKYHYFYWRIGIFFIMAGLAILGLIGVGLVASSSY